MKKNLYLLSTVACLGFATRAMAEEAPPAATGAPPPRVGFQMALRTGYAVPMGKVRGSDPVTGSTDGFAMSDNFSGQVPICIEIGGKVIPNLFVGGYLGLGFGGSAGQLGALCSQGGLTCVTVGVRFG